MKNSYWEGEDTVVDPDCALYLHDRTPMMSALETQALLEEEEIDFLGNNEWHGNSPDLNPTENIGSIVMDRVGIALDKSKSDSKYGVKNLKKTVKKVMTLKI